VLVPHLTQSRNTVGLYASIGPELYQYDVDVDGATLIKRGTVTLPANVHYAWPHASARYLYVASSNSASGMGPAGDRHHVTAFHIDPGSGALTPHGDPIPLPTRPIHMTTDIPSEHLLVAFSNPSGLRVYRINADATPGAEVAQPEPIDPGIYAHQVRVSLDNGSVILVTRGHDAASGTSEEPGALKVFAYRQGRLTKEVSVAPNRGYGFASRHLDFHPTRPLVYVSLERQNKLDLFEFSGDTLSPAPVFHKDTLGRAGQYPGTAGCRHRSCASERPLRLRGQPRLHIHGTRWQACLCRWRKQFRCVFDRPGDRRAQFDPARRDARYSLSHFSYRPERAPAGRRTHHAAPCEG